MNGDRDDVCLPVPLVWGWIYFSIKALLAASVTTLLKTLYQPSDRKPQAVMIHERPLETGIQIHLLPRGLGNPSHMLASGAGSLRITVPRLQDGWTMSASSVTNGSRADYSPF